MSPDQRDNVFSAPDAQPVVDRPKVSSLLLVMIAPLCMFFAFASVSVTMISREAYFNAFVFAIANTAIADFCCVHLILRGGFVRWLGVLIALPSLFVLAEIARRGPYVLGLVP